MLRRFRRFFGAGTLFLLLPVLAGAQGSTDRAAERAARRAQQQIQALQQQLEQAEAAKVAAQKERDDLKQRLATREQAEARAAATQRQSQQQAKELEAARDALSARVPDLERQLADQRQASVAVVATKDRELAAAARRQQDLEGERSAWQQRFVQQARLNTECMDRNERLVSLGGELLQRWQRKGVQEAMQQREPLLGFRDVEMFNLVQEYRDRLEGERFAPSVGTN